MGCTKLTKISKNLKKFLTFTKHEIYEKSKFHDFVIFESE